MLNDESAPKVSLMKRNKLQVEKEDGKENGATQDSSSESDWSSSSSGNLSDYENGDVPWKKRHHTDDETTKKGSYQDKNKKK